MAISRSDCAALILAGGKSSRMGRCKALLPLEGRTFLQRLTGALDGFPHLYLSANDPALARGFPGAAVADRHAGAGPLAGLHAALSASRWPYLFCVPCDLPLLPASLAQPMLDAFPEGCDALVCVDSTGRRHPLCGIYARTALPALEAQLAAGEFRVQGLLSRLRCTWFDAGAWVDDRAFTNLNTPEDYQQLLAHPRA